MSINQLKKYDKNVNISRIFGSSVSVAGTLMVIAGIALASVGLSVAGITLAVLGGGTAASASIIDVFIQKAGIKYVQDELDRDYKQLDAIPQKARKIKEEIDGARQKCPGISEFAAVFGMVFAQGAARITNLRVRVAELTTYGNLEIGAFALRVGNAAARGIAITGTVLTVVLIPIDIAEIIQNSISIPEGSQTKAIKKLIDIVEQLKE